ncbi:MAG TPA: L,D-transpeptidase [Polyangiaceae bacterium]|nr:L,D-transpeptidase [Polyangiaceae bacterium]
MLRPVAVVSCLLLISGAGCKRGSASAAAAASASAAAAVAAPPSTVDHGELDTQAPKDAPRIGSLVIAATVYKLPDVASRRLGYIRLGGSVPRDPEPVSGKGCKGKWYRVYPMGHVCSDEASIDMNEPLLRAASRRPDLSKPLPYKYGFVRATSPQYLRVPSKAEQEKSEFKLAEHLEWFEQNRAEVQKVILGSNDIPLDPRGTALPGGKPPPGFRLSTELSENELFGGEGASDGPPWWLDGGRKIPNVSGFDVPEYAIFADRVRRKTGLSLIGAFNTESSGLSRRFAVTVDLRLIPTTKLKPDTGSPFHGVVLTDKLSLPLGWVSTQDARTYKLIKGKDEARAEETLPFRAVIPLSGKARIKAGERFYQTLKDKTVWVRARDLAVAEAPGALPGPAGKGEKWIDISIAQQSLVLYEGKKPIYATLISTGRDKLGDPKTTLSTPRGSFRLTSKHIAAAMDSEENSSVSGGTRVQAAPSSGASAATIERLKAAEAKGEKLSEDDARRLANVKKGRDPEYGITMRRGASDFELRDVPWIQYFAAGYALHGAYWHDVFGTARSHGCVNLTPIDARYVFLWTDPPLPPGWHGINVGSDMGEGTAVEIRE